MNGLMIVFIVVFVIVVALTIVFGIYLTKQEKERNRNIKSLFFSYDKMKQIRISRLKNDLMDSNELMDELEALELSIELEKRGRRKEVKIDGVEVYL